MRRLASQPRDRWENRVSEIGLTFHSHDNGPYWNETAAYEFTRAEITTLEAAANEVHRLALEAAGEVIRREWWSRLRIPSQAIPAIVNSWERDDFSLYGRFDFAFDGSSAPRLLEYNADTPTSLIEASLAQWFWLRDVHPDADQFNSLHERLIEAWRPWTGQTVHFAAVRDHLEDGQTVLYLRDTAEQAGVHTISVDIEDIGWNTARSRFVDLADHDILRCFKLYPWEWMWAEEFSSHLPAANIQFVEPAWKMLLANKGLLPVLWELFPDHPNLLPAHESPEPLGREYLRKSRLGREGRNVAWIRDGAVLEEDALDVDEGGWVYQAPASIPCFDGQHPVLGVWMINHACGGMGIREDTGKITGNLSRFVPHFFR